MHANVKKWRGDFESGSDKWDETLKKTVGENYFKPGSSTYADETCFWMTDREAFDFLKSLNVCRIRNWDEVRVKGKFLRVQDIDNPKYEVVMSKWYYQVDVEEPTRIFVGLH